MTVNAMRTGSSSIVWSIECSERSMTALTLSTCRGRRAAGRIRLRKRGLREWRVRRTTRLRLRDRTRLDLLGGWAEYALLVVDLQAELTRPTDRERPGLEHYLLLRIGRDDEHALVLPHVSRPVRACVRGVLACAVCARALGRWQAVRTR